MHAAGGARRRVAGPEVQPAPRAPQAVEGRGHDRRTRHGRHAGIAAGPEGAVARTGRRRRAWLLRRATAPTTSRPPTATPRAWRPSVVRRLRLLHARLVHGASLGLVPGGICARRLGPRPPGRCRRRHGRHWLGCDATAPDYQYDYGDNITYQDGEVYYGSQLAGTQQQYYQEAVDLAGCQPRRQLRPEAAVVAAGRFRPDRPGPKTPEMVFQLAVDKAGAIRGNYYDQVSDTTAPVTGAVNKKDQRVAWRVGANKNLVIETGLYNLTQDRSTALVHYGPGSDPAVRARPHQAAGRATAQQP